MSDLEPTATSRQEFIEMLGDLQRQGAIDAGEEAALVREFDTVLAELRDEQQRLEPEFREKARTDGQQAAEQWLEEAARALGTKQGERMRSLLRSIPAIANSEG